MRALRSRVKLSGYVAAAVEQRGADGAELEYNQARGIAGNRFPLELLAPPVETRASRAWCASRPPAHHVVVYTVRALH